MSYIKQIALIKYVIYMKSYTPSNKDNQNKWLYLYMDLITRYFNSEINSLMRVRPIEFVVILLVSADLRFHAIKSDIINEPNFYQIVPN